MARIAIDARAFSSGKGPGRDLPNLLRCLPEVGAHHEYVALGCGQDLEGYCSVRGIAVEGVRGSSAFLQARWGVGRAAVRSKADLLYVIGEVGPAPCGIPYVLHVHEDWRRRFQMHLLTGVAPAGGWRRGAARHFLVRWTFAGSIRRAVAVVASSESTARDLKRWQRPGTLSIHAVHLGADHLPVDVAAVGPAHPFIFHLGSGDSRDNTVTVLNAYAAASKECPSLFRLVVAGALGVLEGPIRRRVSDLGLGDRVTLTGYLEDPALSSYLQSATLCVQPSLFEGFGYTPLEAMRLGAPVIAGDIPVAREILGSAAILVPPGSVVGLARAIIAMANDSSERAALSAAGCLHAARFQWSVTASRIVEILDSVLASTSDSRRLRRS